MLGLYDEIPLVVTIAQIENIPTTDEFRQQIEAYESDAINYFLLVMGVSVITSFLKNLMS